MSLRDRIGPEGMQAAEHRYAVEKAAAALTIGDEMNIARWMVDAFDAAGLLVTPGHDAAVAARALRDAADALDGGIGTSTARFGMDPHDYDSRADYGYAVAEADLRACADRIEREGGAS